MNQANAVLYSTEKAVKDYGDKISADDKSNVERELEKLREAIKGKDHAKIKQAMEDLQKVSHKLAEEVYKATAAAQQNAGASGAHAQESETAAETKEENKKSSSGKDKEDIIDADFKAEDGK